MGAGLKFSIIIPTYNGGDLLRSCLESVCALKFPKQDFEVIVVDNNSNDDSADIIGSFPVTKVDDKRHQSSYAARNAGLEIARGEIIAFTDSDCEVDPNWLSALWEAAKRSPEAGCIAGEILAFPPATTVERFSESIGLLRQQGPLSGWHFKPYAQTANAAYRMEVFDRLGGFAHDQRSGGDAIMSWRMLDNTAYTLVFEPNAIVYHHHRTDIRSLWSQFSRYGGGKLSWAKLQPDYRPPKVDDQESELIAAMDEFLDLLEENGLDEPKFVYPFLSVVSRAAHTNGYLRDILEHISGEQDSDRWPAIAREGSPPRLPVSAAASSNPINCILKAIEPELLGRSRQKRQLQVGERVHANGPIGDVIFVAGLDQRVEGIFDTILVSARPRGIAVPLEQELAYYADRLGVGGLLAIVVGPSPLPAISKADVEGRFQFGTDAGWRIAQLLPEHAVMTARKSDRDGRASGGVVLVSKDGNLLQGLAGQLEADGVAASVVSL